MATITIRIDPDYRDPDIKPYYLSFDLVLTEFAQQPIDYPSEDFTPAKTYEDLIFREAFCTPTSQMIQGTREREEIINKALHHIAKFLHDYLARNDTEMGYKK